MTHQGEGSGTLHRKIPRNLGRRWLGVTVADRGAQASLDPVCNVSRTRNIVDRPARLVWAFQLPTRAENIPCRHEESISGCRRLRHTARRRIACYCAQVICIPHLRLYLAVYVTSPDVRPPQTGGQHKEVYLGLQSRMSITRDSMQETDGSPDDTCQRQYRSATLYTTETRPAFTSFTSIVLAEDQRARSPTRWLELTRRAPSCAQRHSTFQGLAATHRLSGASRPPLATFRHCRPDGIHTVIGRTQGSAERRAYAARTESWWLLAKGRTPGWKGLLGKCSGRPGRGCSFRPLEFRSSISLSRPHIEAIHLGLANAHGATLPPVRPAAGHTKKPPRSMEAAPRNDPSR